MCEKSTARRNTARMREIEAIRWRVPGVTSMLDGVVAGVDRVCPSPYSLEITGFCLELRGQTARRGSADRGEVGLDRRSPRASIVGYYSEICAGFDLTGATHADTLDPRRFSYGCPDGELARDERTRSTTRGHDAPR